MIACVIITLLAMTVMPAAATTNAGKNAGMDAELPEAAAIIAFDSDDRADAALPPVHLRGASNVEWWKRKTCVGDVGWGCFWNACCGGGGL